MTKLSWAAVALGAALALGGVNTAKADYALDFTGSGGFAGSVGTVAIDQVSSSEIDYTVTMTSGALWTSGLESFFAYVTGTIGSIQVSSTNGGTWPASGVIGNISHGNPYDGLGSSLWSVNVDCTAATTNCGTTLTVQVFESTAPGSTALGIGSVNIGGTQVFAGVDVTCNSGNLLPSNTPCAAGSVVPGATGVVGATLVPDLTVPVPAPFVGAGLPGLIAACAGLVALARRRRRRFA
jgi:hypothetical protein